jgi:hypothetical protein
MAEYSCCDHCPRDCPTEDSHSIECGLDECVEGKFQFNEGGPSNA